MSTTLRSAGARFARLVWPPAARARGDGLHADGAAPGWREAFGPPLFAALGCRVFFLATLVLGARLGTHRAELPEDVVARAAALLSRWDGQLYLDIAREGYVSPPLHLRAAFFPLLPALVSGLHALTGFAPLSCGLAAVNLADVLATCVLWRLLRARLGPRHARHALWVWALFPGRLFGVTLGTEGPFTLLSVGAFVAASSGRGVWAWLAAALAGATRAPGVFVGLGLCLQALVDGHYAWAAACQATRRSAGRSPSGRAWAAAMARTLARAGAYALAAVVGPAGFAAYLGHTIGRPWAFAEVQGAWRRAPSWPWQALLRSAEAYDHVACWLALAGLALCLRRTVQQAPRGAKPTLTAGEQAYLALSLLLPLCTGRLMSMQRFVAVAFPLALLGCSVWHAPRRRLAYVVYAVGMAAALGVKLGLGHKVV